jgi:glycosyl transferase family 87
MLVAAVSTRLAAHLRSRDWLSRHQVRTFALVLLTVEIAIFVFLIAGTHGWIVPLETPTTTDFVSFYAAGSLVDVGTPQLAYDHITHLVAEEAISGLGIEYQFFNYPPVFLLLCAMLARLPYLVAFIVFEGASLALYLFVARRILGDWSGTALLVLIAFPIVFWNIGLGQNAFLTAGLFGAAMLFVDKKPVVAGICFGLLCYKPQFGLLVPFALAAGGRWTCLAAAAAAGGALVLASVGLFGWETWHDFFITAGASHAMYESGRILFGGFVSPFGAVRLLGGSVPFAYAIQAGAGLLMGAIVVVVWRRDLSLPTRAAVLTAGTLIASPLSLLYDLMLAAIAACWLLAGDGKEILSSWERSAVAGLFVVLLNPRGVGETLHLPVSTVAVIWLVAIATRRALHEVRAKIAPSPDFGGRAASYSDGHAV